MVVAYRSCLAGIIEPQGGCPPTAHFCLGRRV